MIRRILIPLMAVMAFAVPATASAVTVVCVPSAANTAVITPNKEGKCTEGSLSALPTYEAEGIDKKPTVRFSGVNVQIVNGEGKTELLNGEGNLYIGYDELPGIQTGSHNLVLGYGQKYTSFASLVAGEKDSSTSPFTSVFGESNTVSGTYSAIAGGEENTASGTWSSISGGRKNKATAKISWAGGGESNSATANGASVFGGKGNEAKLEYEAIP